MSKFDFKKTTNTIDDSESFKTFAAPSPDNDYSLTMKYYKNGSLKEGDYHTRKFPYLFSDVFLYLRNKKKQDYAVFKYNGNVWVSRRVIDNVSYDDINNMSEISTDIQAEWESLLSFL